MKKQATNAGKSALPRAGSRTARAEKGRRVETDAGEESGTNGPGDWRELGVDDLPEQERRLRGGLRVRSRYRTRGGLEIRILTDAEEEN